MCYAFERTGLSMMGFWLLMLIGMTDTPGGHVKIIVKRNGSFFTSENSEAEKAVSDPESFFGLLENGIRDSELEPIGEPDTFLLPTPVQRAFLPAVNFRMHGKESSVGRFERPYFFLKFPSSLVPHNGTSYIPRGTEKYDYEGEIAIVIGKKGKYLNRKEAESTIFGYTVANDLSVRDYQTTMFPGYGKNWVLGKAADYALPYGPMVLPKEDAGDFVFNIQTRVNGDLRQDGSTDDMIFSPVELIQDLSNVVMLRPGDIIMSGTPAGVALHSGQGFLHDGDTVTVTVPKIGTLKTYIKAE